MLKINKFISAIVRIDNSADTDRTYEIVADASIYGDNICAVHNGICTACNVASPAITSFASGDAGALSISFAPNLQAGEMAAILSAVNSFLAVARSTPITPNVSTIE